MKSEPVRCPNCHSNQPFFDIADLHSYRFEGNRIRKDLTGHRLACQQCACIFNVGPHGLFKLNRDSFPFAPVKMPRIPDPQLNGKPQSDFEPDRALPPIPLSRPPFQP